ncbi:Protein of unknown function [Bacillus mycoides]|nr:Protein of unknown function [Bacillus mycoides]
MYTDSIDY